jgi:hypothetical protein
VQTIPSSYSHWFSFDCLLSPQTLTCSSPLSPHTVHTFASYWPLLLLNSFFFITN